MGNFFEIFVGFFVNFSPKSCMSWSSVVRKLTRHILCFYQIAMHEELLGKCPDVWGDGVTGGSYGAAEAMLLIKDGIKGVADRWVQVSRIVAKLVFSRVG